MQASLSCSELTIGYKHKHQTRIVLTDIDAEIHGGELVCLLGANGTGKSTLLRTLGAVQPPIAGSVLLGAAQIRELTRIERAKQLGIVLTDRVEVGNLTVHDLVALGRYPHTGWNGRLSDADRTIVDEALAAVGVTQFCKRNVAELSDGERQRVMIARALCQAPSVMLLDEPTAFLDAMARVEVTELLRGLAYDKGLAVLLSTHDLDLALRTADLLWLITPDGRLVRGAPEDCIIDGSLMETFHSDGLVFDPIDARFEPVRDPVGAALCIGNEIAVELTRRALHRVGYEVVDKSDGSRAEIVIDVIADDSNPDAPIAWLVRGADGANMSTTSRHDTIHSLVNSLRSNSMLR